MRYKMKEPLSSSKSLEPAHIFANFDLEGMTGQVHFWTRRAKDSNVKVGTAIAAKYKICAVTLSLIEDLTQ